MEDPNALRRKQIEDNIRQDQELLKEWEDKLRSETDPTERKRCRAEIARLKRSIAEQTAELEQLESEAARPEPTAPTVTALHQLPAPPRDFTGREEELAKLLEAVEQGGVTISGLRGLGGVGKTALALVLAEQLTPCYPDAQFYLDLKGTSKEPLSSAEAMAHVVHAYHPEARPENEAELRALYCSVLHDQRALLLMDNAVGAAQVATLVPPASCLLLVTSRQHFTLPGLHALNLDALPLEDARDLLLAIAPRLAQAPPLPELGEPLPPRFREASRGPEVRAADEIARLCGCLPLALRLAGSALAEREDLSVADYLRRLADAQERLALIDASLSLSYDLLGTERQRLWRTLAVFPATFDRAAAAAVWGLEQDPAQDALSELVAYSLVEWDEAAARYRLHDLARLYADARLDEAERATGQRNHAMYYEAVARAADELYLQGGQALLLLRGLGLFDCEWVNIQAGQEWAAAHAGDDEAVAQLCSAYPGAGLYCLDLRQHPRERIRWLEAALAAARWLKDRAAEGAHLGNLGLAYANLGETRRAIEYHEQALAIDREIGDRRGEGADLGSLGLAYADLGETRRAIEFYEQDLAIAREIGDRRGEGSVLNNLGLAYTALGETRRAIEYHEHALAVFSEIGDRRGEGAVLGNLGLAYADLGETRRAIEYHEQALAIAREISDRRGEGQTLGNLGSAYADLGETRRAIEYHEQALAITRELGDRQGEGAVLGNLGLAYADLGEARRAIEFCERQLVITRKIGDRRGEGNALFNMSLALDKLGERERAIALAEAALRIYEQIEDPNAAKVRRQLAQWRGEQ
jgi:tetratricopeptide (TPR) repeat protein